MNEDEYTLDVENVSNLQLQIGFAITGIGLTPEEKIDIMIRVAHALDRAGFKRRKE